MVHAAAIVDCPAAHPPIRPSYAELHCHSAYSFLDGASPPDEILAEAHKLGYPALALTDRNGIYGSLAFAHAAQPLGIQAITGAEVTLPDGSQLVLLAETPQGYSNLCRLLTEAHLGAERLDPRLPLTAIAARHEGLIVLSGSRRDGLLPRILETQGVSAARKMAEHCKSIFGAERFFVEIQRNKVRGDLALTRALAGIACDLGLSLVATGSVHYHTRELHRLHDVMVAIRHRTTLDGSHRVRNPNSEFFLRPLDEVVALFSDCPNAVATTAAIAQRCKAFDITRDLGYTFPDFRGADRAPASQALAELCNARMHDRYPPGALFHAQAARRLAEELQLIEHHQLSGFFLVYHDLFDLARDVAADIRKGSRRAMGNLLPGRGRGSSVSSIVMDYVNRRRLKLLGRLRFHDVGSVDAGLSAAVALPGYRALVERVAVFDVEALDWNCPQHITRRYTQEEWEAQACSP